MSLAEIMALPVGQLARRDTARHALDLRVDGARRPAARPRCVGLRLQDRDHLAEDDPQGEGPHGPRLSGADHARARGYRDLRQPCAQGVPLGLRRGGREHSRKPEEFYTLVERCCPRASKAMLFSGSRGRAGTPGAAESTKFDAPQPEQKLQGNRTAFVITDEIGLPALFDALPEQRREQGRLILPA